VVQAGVGHLAQGLPVVLEDHLINLHRASVMLEELDSLAGRTMVQVAVGVLAALEAQR
jgi:hypothetical protein